MATYCRASSNSPAKVTAKLQERKRKEGEETWAGGGEERERNRERKVHFRPQKNKSVWLMRDAANTERERDRPCSFTMSGAGALCAEGTQNTAENWQQT